MELLRFHMTRHIKPVKMESLVVGIFNAFPKEAETPRRNAGDCGGSPFNNGVEVPAQQKNQHL